MESSTSKTQPGTGVFYGIMAVISIVLLLLLPIETEPGPAEQGWWTQPILMPAISLVFFAITAVFLFIQHLLSVRKHGAPHDRDTVRAELFQWAQPLEIFVYYVIYIYLLGIVGYFLSSFIFAAGVGWRVGLRSRRWVWAALFFTLGITALFRWGLSIWFPSAALFELLPGGLRIFFARNF
ncbi:MAG: tripartite tricarboxylate transporter TctB family protein [Chloroflexota bacterium]